MNLTPQEILFLYSCLARLAQGHADGVIAFDDDKLPLLYSILAKMGTLRSAAMQALAAPRLPAWWRPTLDAPNCTMLMGAEGVEGGSQTWSRNYERADGAKAEATCSQDGSPITATVEALVAYDVANPLPAHPPLPGEGPEA